MTGRKKALHARKRGKSKQVKSSWQPTLNQYFGGSSVPVQPTLHHFLRRARGTPDPASGQKESLDSGGSVIVVSEEEEEGGSDCRENVPQGSVEVATPRGSRMVLGTLANSPTSDNTLIERAPLPQISLPVHRKEGQGHYQALNPFAVKSVSRVTRPPLNHHSPLEVVNPSEEGGGGRRSLSLKSRKRKLPSSPGRPSIAPGPCSVRNSRRCGGEADESEGGKRLSRNQSAIAGLSKEDHDFLTLYGCGGGRKGGPPSLEDLEEFERCKREGGTSRIVATETGTPSKTKRKRPLLVPHSPTFSPHKPTPTRLLSDSLPPPSLNASLPLFNTPSPHTCTSKPLEPSQGQGRVQAVSSEGPPEEGESGPRRMLFLPLEAHETRTPVDSHSPSMEVRTGNLSHLQPGKTEDSERDLSASDFFFGDDFSLLDEQTLGSHDTTGKSHDLQRYLVLECVTQERVEEEALLSTGRYKPEMMLRLFDQCSNSERICFLRDDWLATEVTPGDMVQINAQLDETRGCYVIDNAGPGSVIVNPDQLISGTTVATGVTCTRRAILSDLFRGGGGNSEAMIFGQMLHSVFQNVIVEATKGSKVTRGMVQAEMKKIVCTLEHLEQLYGLELSDVEAMSKLSEFIPSIEGWCRRFLHDSPQAGLGSVEFSRPGSRGESCVAVTEVLDIEENVWSPRFGLKGRVDVSVRIKERRKGGEEETFEGPLELKTGKMFRAQGSIEHRAQVALYCLMMSDGHYDNVPAGMLYYMKTGHMQGLPMQPHDRRGLLIARNRLAGYYGNRRGHMTFPGMLREKATCKYCPYAPECMLVHRTIEDGTAATSGVPEIFNSHTLRLSQPHMEFFTNWYSLVREEQLYCRETEGPPLWMSEAVEREREGRCLGHMTAKAATVGEGGKTFQTFVKRERGFGTSPHSVTLSPNDRVVVSHQDGSRWAVAMGNITTVTSPTEVLICIDKPVPCEGTVYRLDLFVGQMSVGMPLSNLAKLCLSDSERDCRLRDLVIDLDPPRFTSPKVEEATPTLSTLNASQRLAVSQVMRCLDYSLVLGMPGTGKTTTIACLVRALVTRGNTILLTSYTHSAVDNILLKLKEAGVDFVRLGSVSRIHPDILPFTPAQAARGVTSVEQLERFYQSKAVVATTCLSISHPLFSRRSFDYCILDEATQITLPVSLGPLRYASRFVLVGDHYQLPPLVRSEVGREGGLDVSLFRRLTEHHPQAMVTLECQYRMNSDIMFLSNSLIYNSRLKCGSEAVASSRLHIPHPSQLHKEAWRAGGTWVWRTVNPDQPVVFLNTDTHSARREAHSGEHIHNALEVQMVVTLVDTLIKGGVPPSSVGVITPYRHQQSLISEALVNRCECEGVRSGGVEVNTVDRYQGRDKDCVIVSFVRSNDGRNVGRLLLDWRRVNVALTRARHKLILIGSLTTLASSPVLQSLGALLEERQWVEEVGAGILDPT